MASLEERVTQLELELHKLREKVTDTHTLAAHADQDVANFRDEIRAQTRMINALRQTQVEHYNHHQADLAEVRAEVRAGFSTIVCMLERLMPPEDNS